MENNEPEIELVEEPVSIFLNGVVNVDKLNVRAEPDADSEILGTIDLGTLVMIDETESLNDFYKIFTEFGLEGFCMKQYIMI